MANKSVKLKNKKGDYLYPYTDNVPTGNASVAGKVKVDSFPTSGSRNAISSGAVYTALADKLGKNDTATRTIADKDGNEITLTYQPLKMPVQALATSGKMGLCDNSFYRIAPTDNITFVLPTDLDNQAFHQILVQMQLTKSITIDYGTNCFFGGQTPQISETGFYDLIYEHNGTNWVCGTLSCVRVGTYTPPQLDEAGTLYAWRAKERMIDEIIYTKTTEITADTVLYNADGSVYQGTEWRITDNAVAYQDSEGVSDLIYATRYTDADQT